MMPPLTVNQVLDDLAALDGQPMEVTGLLAAGPEGAWTLQHFPWRERRPGGDLGLAFGHGALKPNAKALVRWIGKRVRVQGVLRVPAGTVGMWTWWSAEVEPHSVQRTGRMHKDADAAAPDSPAA